MNRAIWQISGGPASRAYAEVFLRHGVALIGPGEAGAWVPERDDDEFDGGFVRRFAALRALVKAEQERGPDFLRLAAFSALYPKGSEEKRLTDAMLLGVPR